MPGSSILGGFFTKKALPVASRAASEDRDLKARAADIYKTAEFLSNGLHELGVPEPSFEKGLPEPLQNDAPDSDVGAARQRLIEKLDELRALLTEPALLLTSELASPPIIRNPLVSVHSIVRLGIAEKFPPQGTSVKDIAEKLGLREDLVRRLLAHCATHHIFHESSPDFFEHTAASKILAESDGMRKWVLIGAEELLPATLRTANALARYPNSEEPEHSGWSIHNSMEVPIFKALAHLPDRAQVFAGAMKWHAMLPGYSAQYLATAFPWGSGEELTVVDVGGGLGHVSQALLKHNPHAKCIVEDAAEVVEQGQKDLPATFKDRLQFQAHDFFQEQPITGADIYLLRLVLHDWSDKYAKKIINALIPTLKEGAKVVVNDRVVPGRGEAPYLVEREARDYDMYMLAFQNAKERTASDWATLFTDVDRRFELTQISRPPKSSLAIIEFTWHQKDT